MSQRVKHLDAAIRQVDEQQRRIVFVASAQMVDRDGDVILTSGIQTDRFMKNAVLLGFHDPSFPIGRVLSLSRSQLPDATPALIANAELLPTGQSERVDELWALVKFGALAGVSIGFLPVPGMFDEKKVLPEQTGYTFRAIELLEISLVSIPSCPECLITQKIAGGRSQVAAAVRESLADITRGIEVTAAVRAALAEIAQW